MRVLALEQMQALPYATQLLARLGADVVKVEHPKGGDLGRGSLPAMTDPEGRSVGATFLRNNLSKRSICIDLKSPEPAATSCCAWRRASTSSPRTPRPARWPGSASATTTSPPCTPASIYLSVSGFGNTDSPSPYDAWPAFAPIVEAMSGIYEFKRQGDEPPAGRARSARSATSAPALFAVIGVLAALRHRDATGAGPARRHRHARRHGGDDRHRHQLLVARACGAATSRR